MQQPPDGGSSEQDSAPPSQSRKKGPFIDISLAQESKDYEDLPSIVQGPSPGERSPFDTREFASDDDAITTTTTTSSEYLSAPSVTEGFRSNTPPAGGELKPRNKDKDPVTGRRLSKAPRVCLRCLSKNLRCTLEFHGKENEPRCAACRRAGANHCIRQAVEEVAELTGGEQRSRFAAPKPRPPRNRNDALQLLPADDAAVGWGEVLDDYYYTERLVYVNGHPVELRDVNGMALPSFRDAALAAATEAAEAAEVAESELDFDVDSGYNSSPTRTETETETEAEAEAETAVPAPAPAPVDADAAAMPWRTLGWRDYLPTTENRSLAGEEEDVKDQLRREDGSINAAIAAAVVMDWREHQEEEDGKYDDRIKYLQRIRGYRPREIHLNEMLGETY